MSDYRRFPTENPYRLCERNLRYRDGRPRPCRSPYCASDRCRSKGAEKDSAIMMRSFKDRPPDFASVLRFSDDKSTSAGTMQACLKTFTQKLTNYRKSTGITIEYDIRIEFVHGEPHCHLTLITSAPWTDRRVKKLIRSWWVKSCPQRRVGVYAKRIRDVVGYAKYIAKHVKKRGSVERPPPGWNGKTCRLVRTSNGFLSGPKPSLWKEQCEEWYPKTSRPKSGAASESDAPPQVQLETEPDSLPDNDGGGNTLSSTRTSRIEHSEGIEGQAGLRCDGDERFRRLSGSSPRGNGVNSPPKRVKSPNDGGRESGN